MPQAAAPPRPRLVCKRSELSGGGTASMPVREKGRRSPSSCLPVPSHVPHHPQTAAKVGGFALTPTRCTAETDWLLEQSGFELVWGFSCQVVVFGFCRFFVRRCVQVRLAC